MINIMLFFVKELRVKQTKSREMSPINNPANKIGNLSSLYAHGTGSQLCHSYSRKVSFDNSTLKYSPIDTQRELIVDTASAAFFYRNELEWLWLEEALKLLTFGRFANGEFDGT